jgi:hypothetical protein
VLGFFTRPLPNLYSFVGMPIGDASQPLFDALSRLKQSWPARGWSWDSRFVALASTFTVPYEAQARKAAGDALPAEYTSTTLSNAPPELRDLAARTGGLRSGQLLLAGGPIGGITAFGLWWPWGDGETISMRVGLLDIDMAREPWRRLRDIFAVSM